LTEDAIAANTIESLSLHPTATSINNDCRQLVNKDHHHCICHQPPLPLTMTAIVAVDNEQ
jgi:hypothetical protein